MAVTQADIDALEKVLASGVLTVRYQDRTVTYQTTESMQKELARMKCDLAAASGTTGNQRFAVIDKGL